MKKIITILLLFFIAAMNNGFGQLTFKMLRYDEDYSQLSGDTLKSWYVKTKFTPLSKNKATYVSFGGDIRYQYFRIRHEKWGDIPEDPDGYFFSRLLLHSDLHLGVHARIFGQLQSSMANGKPVTSPVDEDPLELHQGFAEAKGVIGGRNSWMLRIGRQELAYGSQRLIAVRDGPNNRQSFDAVKAVFKMKNAQADFFYGKYVKAKKGLFNDQSNRDIRCWGFYLASNEVPFFNHLDLYYLGLYKKIATFTDGTGRELRHSIGARLFSSPHPFRYDFEMLYQFGQLAVKEIEAWTISLNTGYQFQHAKLKPEFGLKTELISGDHQVGDDKLQTFNPLFPRGGYFGLASLIGPSNLFDIHPSLALTLHPRLQLNIESDIFWRLNKNDGIYGPNAGLIYPGNNNLYKKIGNQMAADLTYTPNVYLYFRLECTWFDAGEFLKAAGKGKDIFFTGLTAQLKF